MDTAAPAGERHAAIAAFVPYRARLSNVNGALLAIRIGAATCSARHAAGVGVLSTASHDVHAVAIRVLLYPSINVPFPSRVACYVARGMIYTRCVSPLSLAMVA